MRMVRNLTQEEKKEKRRIINNFGQPSNSLVRMTQESDIMRALNYLMSALLQLTHAASIASHSPLVCLLSHDTFSPSNALRSLCIPPASSLSAASSLHRPTSFLFIMCIKHGFFLLSCITVCFNFFSHSFSARFLLTTTAISPVIFVLLPFFSTFLLVIFFVVYVSFLTDLPLCIPCSLRNCASSH